MSTTITREEALSISPAYVAFAEGNWDKFESMNSVFSRLKVGQSAITTEDKGKTFVRVKVTSVKPGVDGPVIRVSDGARSWRVDGCDYAAPATGGWPQSEPKAPKTGRTVLKFASSRENDIALGICIGRGYTVTRVRDGQMPFKLVVTTKLKLSQVHEIAGQVYQALDL